MLYISISNTNSMSKRPTSRHTHKLLLARVLVIAMVVIVGALLITKSHAATPVVSSETESGTATSLVKKVADVSASAGQAIQFGGTTCPIGQTGTPPNCAAASNTWPDATNTGVPVGVTLHACASTITASGTYDSCNFIGGVDVRANNVTISRSFVNGQVTAGDNRQTGLVLSDITINCGCGSTTSATPPAIAFSNFTLIRANIYNAGHGVQISNNVTVRDSFIHDLCCDNVAHKDGIISNGGGNATITHNNIDCAVNYCSAAMGLFGDFSAISHWTIDNNLFNTVGSYCLYGGDSASKPFPTATYMTVTNNHFGRKNGTKCGFYGPVAYFNYNTGNNWSGNVWDDTGATVLP